MVRPEVELRFFDKELAAMVPGLVTDFDGDEEAELYRGRPFRAADTGFQSHKVEREEFII